MIAVGLRIGDRLSQIRTNKKPAYNIAKYGRLLQKAVIPKVILSSDKLDMLREIGVIDIDDVIVFISNHSRRNFQHECFVVLVPISTKSL